MMATVCMWEQGCACVLGHSVVMCIFVCLCVPVGTIPEVLTEQLQCAAGDNDVPVRVTSK
jgi:hypothetical protein